MGYGLQMKKHLALGLGIGLMLNYPLLMADDGANSKGADIVVLPCELTATEKTADSSLSMQVRINQPSYKISEKLILEVTPSVDAYITVLDQGSDPKAPERGYPLFSDEEVKAGQTFSSGKLDVEGPVGANVLEIIASRLPYAQDAAATSEKPTQDESGKSKNVNPPAKGKATADANTDEDISRCTLVFQIVDNK